MSNIEYATNTDLVVKELCRINHAEAVKKYRAKLNWMSKMREGDLVARVLEYVDLYDKTPYPISVLKEYLAKQELTQGLLEDIASIEEMPEEVTPKGIDDLICSSHKLVRQAFGLRAFADASGYLVRGAKMKGEPIPNSDTPTWCMRWLAHKMQQDWQEVDPGYWLHESQDVLADVLSKDHGQERVFTGFKSFDRDLVLSKKMNPFWVAMGFAHEGKSTILTAILYNLLLCEPGLKIAYFSGEHDAKLDLLPRLAFIHAYKFKKEYAWVLPSMNAWFAGKKTRQDVERMAIVIQDVMKLPGKIVLHGLPPWDEIVSTLNADKFDVCAVDYLGIIPTPGVKEQYKREEIRRLVSEAQKLTRNYNNGEGLIFVTPAQINRQGKKDSEKKEEGERKYDFTALSQHSELYQDADFLMSIFSDDEMKVQGKWLLEVLKIKHLRPRSYPLAVLQQDESSGHVRETIGTGGNTDWADRSPFRQLTDTSVGEDIVRIADEL